MFLTVIFMSIFFVAMLFYALFSAAAEEEKFKRSPHRKHNDHVEL